MSRNYHNSDNGSNDLLRREQNYRHKLQDQYFKSSVISFRIGQVFGLIYNIALLYFVYALIKDGDADIALKIFFLNVALIVFVAVYSKPPKRKTMRRRTSRNSRPGNRDRNTNSRSNNSHNSRRR